MTSGNYIASNQVFYCPGDKTHGATTYETLAAFSAGEGNWPTRISYNYFENAFKRSQPWDFNSPIPYYPDDKTETKTPGLIVAYDTFAAWINVTPMVVNHPKGAYDQANWNSVGGSISNVLCFDGSAHGILVCTSFSAGRILRFR